MPTGGKTPSPCKEGDAGGEEGGGKEGGEEEGVRRREETFMKLSRVSRSLGYLVWEQEHELQLGVEEVGSYHVKGPVAQDGHRAKETETQHVNSL